MEPSSVIEHAVGKMSLKTKERYTIAGPTFGDQKYVTKGYDNTVVVVTVSAGKYSLNFKPVFP
jgi:hypothetical protein